jgi:uncharacterized integral membrane protein
MNDEGESIIEEYLILVREKLPDSIAEDVINELRSYMHESARDQGAGEITPQSAKKVVAQFGAPGEVADEYKYSMLPETIPEEIIPSEIVQEPLQIAKQEPLQQLKPQLTPISQDNLTVSYTSFAVVTSILSWIWIIIVSLFTILISPIGIPIWSIFTPISQALIVTSVIILLALYSKIKKKILWRRGYQEWSALHSFVTLPENSIPETSINVRRLDVLTSIAGIILFLSNSVLSYNLFFFSFYGMPICILLTSRIYYIAVTHSDDSDPVRNSRKQFAINLSLVILLNASLYWVTNGWWYGFIGGYFLLSMSPVIIPFIIGYGSILLFNIVTGTQNLWWKVQEEPKKSSMREESIQVEDKSELLTRLPRTTGRLYAKIVGWIVVYNLPQICISFDHASFDYVSGDFYNWIVLVIFGIAIAGLLIVFYFPYRWFMIKRHNSRLLFGRRTRIEATIDALISSAVLIFILWLLLPPNTSHIIQYSIIDYQRHLGVRWSIILATMEITAYPLGAIALIIRILGNIFEFKPVWKKRAIGLIEMSGILLVLAITAFMGVEYLKWIVINHWYFNFYIPYLIFLPLILFLAFQIGSLSIKGKMAKKNHQDKKGSSVKSRDIYSSIAN